MSRADELSSLLGDTPDVAPRQVFSINAELTPADVAKEIVKRERAKANLIDFCTFIDPHYKPFPVHRLLARKLEDVEAGRLRRLAIFVPPASGKSRIASELFPAWSIGRNARLKLIEASYSADLAFDFGRTVRNILLHPAYRILFPETEVASDARSMDSWKTTAGGEYKAEGVGGGLIGFHANIAIIDDPFKGYDTASSPSHCEGVWNWFTGVLLNRLQSYADGPGAVVVIMQRWTDRDLGGRIEKLSLSGEEAWEIISLPSIAEANDPLGRACGEPLLPEGPNRRTLEELVALRARNPRLFNALHQQQPVSDEGDYFRTGWLQAYLPTELPQAMTLYGASDIAITPGGGDYTVHAVVGVDLTGHVWVVDWWRDQVGIEEGVEKCISMMKSCLAVDALRKGLIRKWFFERVGLQRAFGPLLRKRMREEKLYVTLEDVSIIGLGGKAAPERAGVLAGALQGGYFHIPERAEWRGALEYELSRFPNGTHDDQVDVLVLIALKLEKLQGSGPKAERRGGPPQLEPVLLTFNALVDLNRRKRIGLPTRNRCMVLSMAPQSVLDDGEEIAA